MEVVMNETMMTETSQDEELGSRPAVSFQDPLREAVADEPINNDHEDDDVVPVNVAPPKQGRHMDLATGATTTRSQSVRLVSLEEQMPTKHTWGTRLKKVTEDGMGKMADGVSAVTGQPQGDKPQQDGPLQYRIESRLQESDSFLRAWGAVNLEEYYVSWLSNYLHWTFRASFFDVTLVSFVFFMVLIVIFALFVFWVDRHQPECIVGIERGANGTANLDFGDAYHLSWTTLSTVGYGIIAPGLPSTTENHSRCTGLNMLMAFESFVGVLFGGLTGAIVFAKVARIQSIAPVRFSDPVVIRYGSGCVQRARDADEAERRALEQGLTDQVADPEAELPCPILEFRLVNTMWNQKGGEIMDATVHLVASRLETMSEMDKRMSRRKKRKKRKGKAHKPAPKQAPRNTPSLTGDQRANLASGSMVQRMNQGFISSAMDAANAQMPAPTDQQDNKGTDPYNSTAAQNDRLQQQLHDEVSAHLSMMAGGPAPTVAVDEGNTNDQKLAPRRIFHTLEVQTDSHPFFKRTWNIRHVCDEHSPLLSLRVRRMIEENHGFWPRELNSYDAVRKAINFHEILVSFSGTANVSGSAMYSQKQYEYVDMTVGYAFANVLTKDKEGRLVVDVSLLNDVKEQRGGGAEPIALKDAPAFVDYANTDLENAGDSHDGPSGLDDMEEEELDEKKEADEEYA